MSQFDQDQFDRARFDQEFQDDSPRRAPWARRALTVCGVVALVAGAVAVRDGKLADEFGVDAQAGFFCPETLEKVAGAVTGAADGARRWVVNISAPQSAKGEREQQVEKERRLKGDFDQPLTVTGSRAQGATRAEGQGDVQIVMQQSDGQNSYTVRIDDGEVSAEANGDEVPDDRIRRSKGRVELLGEDGEVVATFNYLPAQPARGARGGGDEKQELRRLYKSGQPGQGEGAQGEWRRFYETAPRAPLAQSGPAPKVMLGIVMTEPDEELARKYDLDEGEATVIADVYEGLPADEAGLRANDVIVGIDGDDGAGQEKIREVLREKEAGETVKLRVMRGDEGTIELKVELEAFDAQRLGQPGAPGEPFLREFNPEGLDDAARERLRQAERAMRDAMREMERHGGVGALRRRAGPEGEGPDVMLFEPDGEGMFRFRGEQFDGRMKQLDERMEQLDRQMDEINTRFDRLEKALEKLAKDRKN